MERTSTGRPAPRSSRGERLRSAWLAFATALALGLGAGCGSGTGTTSVTSQAATAGATCNPDGAHPKHAFAPCQTCHLCRGVVQFDPAGAAVGASMPAPVFDPATKTCSNVACHAVQPGTFSYSFPDGSGEPALVTVSYGGGAARPTPAWTSAGLGCAACHDNPPRTGSTGSNAWHSGYHGGQGPTGANNQCQLCHPDATGTGGVGTAITNPALHANRVANVSATFKRACFGCH